MGENLRGKEPCLEALWDLCQQVGWRLRTAGLAGYTVTLKIKLADFRLLTRSRTCDVPVQLDEEIMEQIRYLAEEVSWREPVRLLGVAVSHLAPRGESPGGLIWEMLSGTGNGPRLSMD